MQALIWLGIPLIAGIGASAWAVADRGSAKTSHRRLLQRAQHHGR